MRVYAYVANNQQASRRDKQKWDQVPVKLLLTGLLGFVRGAASGVDAGSSGRPEWIGVDEKLRG